MSPGRENRPDSFHPSGWFHSQHAWRCHITSSKLGTCIYQNRRMQRWDTKLTNVEITVESITTFQEQVTKPLSQCWRWTYLYQANFQLYGMIDFITDGNQLDFFYSKIMICKVYSMEYKCKCKMVCRYKHNTNVMVRYAQVNKFTSLFLCTFHHNLQLLKKTIIWKRQWRNKKLVHLLTCVCPTITFVWCLYLHTILHHTNPYFWIEKIKLVAIDNEVSRTIYLKIVQTSSRDPTREVRCHWVDPYKLLYQANLFHKYYHLI